MVLSFKLCSRVFHLISSLSLFLAVISSTHPTVEDSDHHHRHNGTGEPVSQKNGNFTHDLGNEMVCSNYVNQPFRAMLMSVATIEKGFSFSRDLIEQKLAAIVNVIPQIISVYLGDDGEVQEAEQALLLIYTHESKFNAIQDFMKNQTLRIEHGVVMLRIFGGSTSFLQWIEHRTRFGQSNDYPSDKPISCQHSSSHLKNGSSSND